MMWTRKLFPLCNEQAMTVNRSLAMRNFSIKSPVHFISSIFSSLRKKPDTSKEFTLSCPIGIDLGTTKSCIAVLDGDIPKVLENEEGSRTFPSVITITDDGKHIFGNQAKQQALTNPRNTLFSTKRLMGSWIDRPEFKIYKDQAQYKIGEKIYTPKDVATCIYGNLKSIAESCLKTEINNAIITVPSHMYSNQHQVIDAAAKAGLYAMMVVPESQAVAMASILNNSNDKWNAIYDFGGGKFEISIFKMNPEDDLEVLKFISLSNNFLGGDDLDSDLLDFFKETFMEQSGIDVSNDIVAMWRLQEAAVDAKIQLSQLSEVEINIPDLALNSAGKFKHFNTTLTREEFENRNHHMFVRTIRECERLLKYEKINKKDINEVLLVGGMTKIPKVRNLVEEFFEQSSSQRINPDEVVAIGATLFSLRRFRVPHSYRRYT